MKDSDKNKKSSYLQYWDVNNVYGWAILQILQVANFEWIEDISQFNEMKSLEKLLIFQEGNFKAQKIKENPPQEK